MWPPRFQSPGQAQGSRSLSVPASGEPPTLYVPKHTDSSLTLFRPYRLNCLIKEATTILTEGAVGRLGKAEEATQTLVQANRARGLAAEANIAARFPGAGTHVVKETKLGTRVIDVLTQQGVAIESKVGKTSLTKDIQQQIAKDVELMKNPTSGVKSAEWRFSRSGATGEIGPTAPLHDALDKAGIKVILE